MTYFLIPILCAMFLGILISVFIKNKVYKIIAFISILLFSNLIECRDFFSYGPNDFLRIYFSNLVQVGLGLFLFHVLPAIISYLIMKNLVLKN